MTIPSPALIAQWLEAALGIAQQAGQAILAYYQQPADYTVQLKADQSPVTSADLAAHKVIAEGLARLTPDIPLLSEELEAPDFAIREQWRCYWLVDPLDGTRQFIRGDPGFSVNLALIVDQEPHLGIVYAPVSQVSYFAQKGAFAYKQHSAEKPLPIRVRPAHHPAIVMSSRREQQNPLLNHFLSRLGDYTVMTLGSSLKSCLIAEGQADIYPRFGHTSEWDTAAAQCVLETAGGHLTDTRLQPLRYNTKPSLLNPHFFAFGDNRRRWADYLA